MKKETEVTSYRVFDMTSNILFNGNCETVEEAESLAMNADYERFSEYLESNRSSPFNSHNYIIVKLRGLARTEIEDDSKVPSFRELCEAIQIFDEGKFVKKVDFTKVGQNSE